MLVARHALMLCLALTVSINITLPAQTSAEPLVPAPSVDYVVQPGDSCLGIAARLLGDRRRYREIHDRNPTLGAEPHHLVPGTILKLPPYKTDPDANLTGARGRVGFRTPSQQAWSNAQMGMDLFRAWRVGSFDEASADVTFRDQSLLHMRERTVVIIFGPTRTTAAITGTVVELEKGALETRLAELTGPAPEVRTPAAVSTLNLGNALVVVDEQGTSWVGNHKGRPIAVRPRNARKRPPVSVAVGMGSKVRKGSAPTSPRPLPPAPVAAPGPRVFVASPATPDRGELVLAFDAVTNAAAYRAVLRDQAGTEIATSQIAADKTRLVFANLPLGDYTLTLATIDTDGFESIPSEPIALALTQLRVAAAGGTQPQPAQLTQLLVGATLVAPPGVVCSLESPQTAPTVRVSIPGPQTLICYHVADRHYEILRHAVVGHGYQLSVSQPGKQPGQANQRTLTLRAAQPLPEGLAAKLTVTAEGASWRASSPAALNAPTTVDFTGLLTPSVGATAATLTVALEGLTLGVVTLPLATQAATPSAAPAERGEVGADLGIVQVFAASDLGQPASPSQSMGHGSRLALHGAWLAGRLRLGARAAAVFAGYADRVGLAYASYGQLEAGVALYQHADIELRATLGAGAWALLAGDEGKHGHVSPHGAAALQASFALGHAYWLSTAVQTHLLAGFESTLAVHSELLVGIDRRF